MHNEYSMPEVENHMHKMKEKCKEEFFATPEGRKYKERHEQLVRELGALHAEMDKKVYHHMASMYPC